MTGLVKKNGTLALDTRRGLAAGCGAPQRGALAASQGLAEAYTYDAYGKVNLWGYRDFDFDRDGDVDSSEYNYMLGAGEFDCCPTSDPGTDGDMDGGERRERERAATGKASKDACVRPATCPDGASMRRATGGCDQYDLLMVQQTSSGAPPVTLHTSGLGNPYFFTGRRLHLYQNFALSGVNPNKQLQFNRARHYSPDDGRWMQRDPAGYVDGMNLYEYVRSGPTTRVDPFGLKGESRGPWISDGEAYWKLMDEPYVFFDVNIELPTPEQGWLGLIFTFLSESEIVDEYFGLRMAVPVRDIWKHAGAWPKQLQGMPCYCLWALKQDCKRCVIISSENPGNRRYWTTEFWERKNGICRRKITTSSLQLSGESHQFQFHCNCPSPNNQRVERTMSGSSLVREPNKAEWCCPDKPKATCGCR